MKTIRSMVFGAVAFAVMTAACTAQTQDAGYGETEATGHSAADLSTGKPGPNLPPKTCKVTPADGPPIDTNVDDPGLRISVVRGLLEAAMNTAMSTASTGAGATIKWASTSARPTQCGYSCFAPFGMVQTQSCAPTHNDDYFEYGILLDLQASKDGITIDIAVDMKLILTCDGWRVDQGKPGVAFGAPGISVEDNSILGSVVNFFSDGSFDTYITAAIEESFGTGSGTALPSFLLPSSCSSIGVFSNAPSGSAAADVVVWGQ